MRVCLLLDLGDFLTGGSRVIQQFVRNARSRRGDLCGRWALRERQEVRGDKV